LRELEDSPCLEPKVGDEIVEIVIVKRHRPRIIFFELSPIKACWNWLFQFVDHGHDSFDLDSIMRPIIGASESRELTIPAVSLATIVSLRE